jgi:hypothetical protein
MPFALGPRFLPQLPPSRTLDGPALDQSFGEPIAGNPHSFGHVFMPMLLAFFAPPVHWSHGSFSWFAWDGLHGLLASRTFGWIFPFHLLTFHLLTSTSSFLLYDWAATLTSKQKSVRYHRTGELPLKSSRLRLLFNPLRQLGEDKPPIKKGHRHRLRMPRILSSGRIVASSRVAEAFVMPVLLHPQQADNQVVEVIPYRNFSRHPPPPRLSARASGPFRPWKSRP